MIKDLVAQIVITAKDLTKPATKSVNTGLSSIGNQISKLKILALGFLSINFATRLAKNIVKTADTYKEASDRIKVATNSQEEYNAAQTGLFQIAQKTRSELGAVNILFSRTNKSILDLGKTQADTLKLVGIVTQAGKISGAAASENNAAIRQFSQALASGVLRGDEFNSIMENSPRLALALADGLRVTKGELRKMAEAGKLSSEIVVNALLSQTEAVEGEFGKITKTVSGALVQLDNAWTKFIGQLSESSGAASTLASSISFVTENFTTLANTALTAISIIATAFIGKGIASLVSYGKAQLASIRLAKLTQLSALNTAKSNLAEAQSRVASTKSLISQITHTETLIRLRFQLLGQTQNLAKAEAELAIVTGKSTGAISKLKGAFSSFGVFGTILILQTVWETVWKIGTSAQENIPWVAKLGQNIAEMAAKFIAFGEVLLSGNIAAFFNGEFAKKIKEIEEDFNDVGKSVEKLSVADKKRLEDAKVLESQLAKGKKDRITLEKELAEETKKLAIQSSKEEIKAHKKVVQELEKDVQDSIAKQQQLADKIISLQQSISGEQERASDKIRRLKREGLTEDQQQLDIQAQLAEVLREAQEALQAGDAEEAKRQAKRAESIGDELNDKQKVIQAIIDSSAISQAADQLSIENAEKAKEAEKAKQLALEERIVSQKEALADLNASLLELEKPKKLVIEENIDAITKKVDELKQKLSDLKGDANISTSNVPIQKNNKGGRVVGAGGVDNILSWLTKDEFVVPENIASKMMPTLNYLLAHGELPKFAAGGSTARAFGVKSNILSAISQSSSSAPRLSSSSNSGGGSFNVVLGNGETFGNFDGSNDAVANLREALGREALKFARRS